MIGDKFKAISDTGEAFNDPRELQMKEFPHFINYPQYGPGILLVPPGFSPGSSRNKLALPCSQGLLSYV